MPKVVFTSKRGLVQSAGRGVELGGGLNLTASETIDAPAAAAAVAASTIATGTNLSLITQGNDANDRVYLPSPTSVPLGHVLIIVDSEGGGFELGSLGDGETATTINGTAVTNAAGTFTKELAFAADVLAICVKIGPNAWSVGQATMGTPDA